MDQGIKWLKFHASDHQHPDTGTLPKVIYPGITFAGNGSKVEAMGLEDGVVYIAVKNLQGGVTKLCIPFTNVKEAELE